MKFGLINLTLILIIIGCMPQKFDINRLREPKTNVAPCISSDKSFNNEDVDWLKANSWELNQDNFSNSGFSQQIVNELSNSQIVGIGESSHGSHELLELRIELTKLLITAMGFRVIGIEIPWLQALSLNDYILGRIDDVRLALSDSQAWIINNQEMSDFLVWLKDYNKRVGQEKGVLIFGYDYSTDNLSQKIGYLENAVNRLGIENSSNSFTPFDCLVPANKDYRQVSKEERSSCRTIIENISSILTSNQNYATFIEQDISMNISVGIFDLLQYEEVESSNSTVDGATRDQLMFEKIEQLFSNFYRSEEKIILWGHNTHIGKNVYLNTNTGTMGYRLNDQYSSSYYGIGMTFYSGSFNAIPLDQPHSVVDSPGDSYEALFNSSGIPSFYLPLNRGQNPVWFEKPHCLRSIGSTYNNEKPEYSWDVDKLPKEFNGFVFINISTPTILFK